jgi:hypothetical protein
VTGTTLIAVYAAIVGTAGLVWQVTSWYLDRRTRVKVDIEIGVLVPQGHDTVTVKAVNQSGHTVQVLNAYLLLQDGSGRRLTPMQVPPGATIPGTVEPHGVVSTYFLRDELPAIDLYAALVAQVDTADGVFESPPRTLLTRS